MDDCQCDYITKLEEKYHGCNTKFWQGAIIVASEAPSMKWNQFQSKINGWKYLFHQNIHSWIVVCVLEGGIS